MQFWDKRWMNEYDVAFRGREKLWLEILMKAEKQVNMVLGSSRSENFETL